MDPQILKTLNAARANREACVLVTDMSDGRDRLIYSTDAGSVEGDLGEAIRSALRSGNAEIVELEGRQFFINPQLPALHIVIVGAVHIAQALVEIAKTSGFDCTVIDPRAAFATKERFKDVALFAEWPEDVFKHAPLDNFSAMAALTHDPKIDDKALIEALNADCIYIGALGSKKTHAKRLERLKDAGLDDEKLARIAAPIGLNIGATNPAEIAVSIMAQIILSLRGSKQS